MSNMPSLTVINRGSGQRCRPKSRWRGYRPPRSAKQRHQHLMAFRRVQKAMRKAQVEIKGLSEAIENDEAAKGLIRNG